MCDFQPVFHEFTTNVEMSGNLERSLTFKNESLERGKGYEGGGTGSICGLFVGLSVVSGDSSATFVFGDDFQTARLVSQKDVRNFLHQGRVGSHAAVIRVENDNSSTVWQRTRTGAT